MVAIAELETWMLLTQTASRTGAPNLDRDILTQSWIARFPHLTLAALADGRDNF
jgi:hypothetical protein